MGETKETLLFSRIRRSLNRKDAVDRVREELDKFHGSVRVVKDQYHNNLLHVFAMKGSLPLFVLGLEYGVSPLEQNREGETPMELMLQNTSNPLRVMRRVFGTLTKLSKRDVCAAIVRLTRNGHRVLWNHTFKPQEKAYVIVATVDFAGHKELTKPMLAALHEFEMRNIALITALFPEFSTNALDWLLGYKYTRRILNKALTEALVHMKISAVQTFIKHNVTITERVKEHALRKNPDCEFLIKRFT
jgi:hypothetical protein